MKPFKIKALLLLLTIIGATTTECEIHKIVMQFDITAVDKVYKALIIIKYSIKINAPACVGSFLTKSSRNHKAGHLLYFNFLGIDVIFADSL